MALKQVSFDVWNTLIKANLDYASARTELIAKTCQVPQKRVSEEYTNVKRYCDWVSKEKGVSVPSSVTWQMFIEQIGKNFVSQRNALNYHELYEYLMTEVRNLFFKYPPIIENYNQQAIQALVQEGFSLNVASNSNFISGTQMKPFLKKMYGPNTFRFHLYSDLLGYAKPSYGFFQKVTQNAFNTVGASPGEIIHVGDDNQYDCGALELGMKVHIVTGPKCIPQVVDKILRGDY